MSDGTCTIEGCEKPLRSRFADYCAMHYHRWYRHGDPLKVATKSGITASLGRRYTRSAVLNHPIADKSGRAWEHRVVLYDEIGMGPHECHWCGTAVDWLPKGHPGSLQVDHLNNDGSDNRVENLVPACCRCNTARGQQQRSDALREAGWWSNNDTIAELAVGRRPRVA
jgi:hypothetical protein